MLTEKRIEDLKAGRNPDDLIDAVVTLQAQLVHQHKAYKYLEGLHRESWIEVEECESVIAELSEAVDIIRRVQESSDQDGSLIEALNTLYDYDLPEILDIPDHLVLFLGSQESYEKRSAGGWFLHKTLGIASRVVEKKLKEHQFDDTTIYGTGLFTYWLTPEGKEALTVLNKGCDHPHCPICAGHELVEDREEPPKNSIDKVYRATRFLTQRASNADSEGADPYRVSIALGEEDTGATYTIKADDD